MARRTRRIQMNNKKQLQALRNKLQTVCSLSCFAQSSFSFCHWETHKKISATGINVFREAYFINKFNFNSPCILMKRREVSVSQLRNWSTYSNTKSLGIFGIINTAASVATPDRTKFGIYGGCFRASLCWLWHLPLQSWAEKVQP